MNYVDENGKVCEITRKLRPKAKNGEKSSISSGRVTSRKPTKAEKSNKLAEGKLFRKCAKKYIKAKKIKKRSIVMHLIDEIAGSYGMKKYVREHKGRKDFHDITTTNYLLDESKDKPKIKKTFSRMSREKVKKLLGGPNSAQKHVLIQFSNRRCFYRRLSLSQYLKMLKIARLAIQTDMYVFFDGADSDEPDVIRIHQNRLSEMRHLMDEYGEIAYEGDYPTCEQVMSFPTAIISSINELLEWHCNFGSMIDAMCLMFETSFSYDYVEDDHKILVYEKSGKIKYYNNIYTFLKDYGFHDSYS